MTYTSPFDPSRLKRVSMPSMAVTWGTPSSPMVALTSHTRKAFRAL